jgi:hypothetical protein
MDRRRLIGAMGAAAVSLAIGGRAWAKGLGLSSILGKASDSALDKLAVPGAFYDDPEIRIGLPLVGKVGGLGGSGGGLGGALGSVLGGAGGGALDVTGGLVRKLNDAAGVAAGEAKPIFRAAIDNLSFTDVPGIVGKNDGATSYLRTSAGDELQGKLRPLVDGALGNAGAYQELDSLSEKHSFLASAGLSSDRLGHTVTEQALDGIFKYIGLEEARFRKDPVGKAGKLLKGVF